MIKTAAAALLFLLCLSGCAVQESPHLSSEQAEHASQDLQEPDSLTVLTFLESHVELKEKMEQNSYSYMLSKGKRDNSSEDYFIVSIGTNSAEKFTATERYYIRFDFSEIIKANPIGKDIVVWTK